jgi:hypothetical protein
LRHDSDVGFVTAVIGETVVTQSVLQMAQQHNVVLEPDVRTASATATAAAPTAATAEASATPCCGCAMSPATASGSRSGVTGPGCGSRRCVARPSGRRAVSVDGLPVACRPSTSCLLAAISALGAIADIGPACSLADVGPVCSLTDIGPVRALT